MNASQNKLLYGLLNKTGLLNQKATLVFNVTKGRTESTKEMTWQETRLLINYLQSQDPQAARANKMRRKMFSLAHEMQWHISGTQKVDGARLDAWCEKYGYLHKKLNSYTYLELPKLVSQFESLHKHFLTNI